MLRYDSYEVAISFSEESDWVAKDLNNFLKELGIKTFYYKDNHDLTKGELDNKIYDILTYSSLNVVIWSKEYSEKKYDDIITTEKKAIQERHINKGDTDTLMIITIDNHPLSKYFNLISFHNLYQVGFYKIRNYLLDRLLSQYSYIDEDRNLKMFHPEGDLRSRGTMTLCEFTMDSDYSKAPGWNKYCDMKVTIQNINREVELQDIVYLIPSGRVTNLLSHPRILNSQKVNRDIKRELTERFFSENKNQKLTGFFFYRLYDDKEFPYIYCFNYDEYLNQGLMDYKYKYIK